MSARNPSLKHCHIVRLSRLMNMMYKPVEIAAEIGVNIDTVYRSYLPAGLPHLRDDNGEIWIHGLTFASWARETVVKKKSKRAGLLEGQAWCLKCNAVVPLINPTVKPVNYFLEILQAICPDCGRTVNRARKAKTGGTQ